MAELAVARAVPALRREVAAWRAQGLRVGLVPTMGALHAGHMALVGAALRDCDRVVASIFVNPRQFGPAEDFARYPRDEPADRALLEQGGAHLLFAPTVEAMYPHGFATRVELDGSLTAGLCAPLRPGHFTGVATIVAKLLLQVLPDRAYFGEKDFQQLQVVRRLAADLDIPVMIEGVATVREPDGLALSSRNRFLSAEHRRRAPALAAELRSLARAARPGLPLAPLLERGRQRLAEAGFDRTDYLEVRDAATLAPLGTVHAERPARALGACWLGAVRLIDNLPIPDDGAASGGVFAREAA